MVRELMRMRIGDHLRVKQQAVVQAFGIASRGKGDLNLAQYLAESLKMHMLESFGEADPLTDKQCTDWLDANDETAHVFSVTAAEVIGRARLLQMGQKLKDEGLKYLAARRFIAAEKTSEPWADGFNYDIGTTAESVTAATVLQWAVDLLEQAEQTVATRSLEALARSILTMHIPTASDEFMVSATRTKQLLAEGIDVQSPQELAWIAQTEFVLACMQVP